MWGRISLRLRRRLFGGVSAALRVFHFTEPRWSRCSKNGYDFPTNRLCINWVTNSMKVVLFTWCLCASSVNSSRSPNTVGSSFSYYLSQLFRSCALSPFLWVMSFYIFFCPSESTFELMCSCGGMFRSAPFVRACIWHVACTVSNNLSRSECTELSITVALHVDIPLYPN